jgi:hypothetical protein
MSEATEMGLHLGKHLHSLHGAGFFDDFKRGFMSVVSPVAGIAKSVLPMMGPEGMAASGVMNAIGLGKRRGGVKPTPAQIIQNAVDSQNRSAADFTTKAKKAERARLMKQYLDRKETNDEREVRQRSEEVMDMTSGSPNTLQRYEDDMGITEAIGKGRRRRGAGKLVITHGGATNSNTGRYNGKGRRRGCGTGAGRESEDAAMMGMGMLGQDGHGVRQGGGFLSDLGIPVVSNLAGMIGLGTGGRRRRAPAGPSDGRRKRAEIVKKVMADKGCSMIEASKYVKAHNLY